jgi:hypothetical protein
MITEITMNLIRLSKPKYHQAQKEPGEREG